MSNTISWNLQMSVREGRLNDARELMSEMVAGTQQEPGTQARRRELPSTVWGRLTLGGWVDSIADPPPVIGSAG
jgi:hypothetical protein